MSRYRWMQADWPVSIRALAKRVRERPFSIGESGGFILDRVRDDFLEARYIERYEFQETVSDPFGEQLTFDRLEFRQASFRASLGWPGLELVDASRSSLSLVNQLVEISNFTLPIAPLTVDVLRWANAFQQTIDSPIVIDSIQLGSLQVEDGIKAKIILKGDKDVRAACEELIHGRKHVLEKLRCRIVQGDLRASILVANNASAKIDGHGLHEELLSALRASLPKAGKGDGEN